MSLSKTDKFINYMKMGDITIPKLLFLNYKKFNITNEEFIILAYLLNTNNSSYNPKVIAEELNIKLNNLLIIINNLCEKQIISINLEKNSNNVLEEKLSFDLLYSKLAMIIMDDTVDNLKENKTSTSLFEMFEQEFGRTLSPMEYEIINGWINDNFSEELIIEALKEATFNGVSSLRYIDRILLEWKKKNIKTKQDVQKTQKKHRENKEENVEIFDYDWLNG